MLTYCRGENINVCSMENNYHSAFKHNQCNQWRRFLFVILISGELFQKLWNTKKMHSSNLFIFFPTSFIAIHLFSACCDELTFQLPAFPQFIPNLFIIKSRLYYYFRSALSSPRHVFFTKRNAPLQLLQNVLLVLATTWQIAQLSASLQCLSSI